MGKALILALTALIAFGCAPSATEKEKQEAWESYFDETFEIVDTIIHYNLTQTSLTLTFETPPQFNQWIAAISITDSIGETLFYFVDRENNQLDSVTFRQGTLLVENFNLGSVPPSSCNVRLELAPIIPGKTLWSNPIFGFPYVMLDRENNGTLKPWKKFYEVNYMTFDKAYFNSLSPELQDYCSTKKAAYISKNPLFVNRVTPKEADHKNVSPITENANNPKHSLAPAFA